MYEYSFHLTSTGGLLYSPAVVMLFGRNTFSLPLVYNLVLLPPVYESPSFSGCIIQPLGSELVALSSILSVDDSRNSRRMVTFRVHWLRNYCTRIRLRVTADTNRLGRN